jgi:hypothetical protein
VAAPKAPTRGHTLVATVANTVPKCMHAVHTLPQGCELMGWGSPGNHVATRLQCVQMLLLNPSLLLLMLLL